MTKRRTEICLLAALLLLGALLCGCGERSTQAQAQGLELRFLNTGKSDCILLRMDGAVYVVDTADADDFDALRAVLSEWGAERIDCLILTHYDKDHIGSAARLLREIEVTRLVGPAYREPSVAFAALEQAAAERGVTWEFITEDIYLGTEQRGLRIDATAEERGDDDNNWSLITTVYYDEERFLLLGDAKKSRLQEFLPLCEESYTLVKLPHHGDDNKALRQLLEQTRPAYAVEMVSDADVIEDKLLETLAGIGTQLYATRDGAITLTLQNGELHVASE